MKLPLVLVVAGVSTSHFLDPQGMSPLLGGLGFASLLPAYVHAWWRAGCMLGEGVTSRVDGGRLLLGLEQPRPLRPRTAMQVCFVISWPRDTR